jgi:hypothetical protein
LQCSETTGPLCLFQGIPYLFSFALACSYLDSSYRGCWRQGEYPDKEYKTPISPPLPRFNADIQPRHPRQEKAELLIGELRAAIWEVKILEQAV